MLTKEVHWQLELLQILDQQDKWYSRSDLSHITGLNVNTIQKYLDQLQALMQDFSAVSLEKHRNYGVRLVREPDFPLHRLLRDIVRQSTLVRLLEELLVSGKVDTQEFCEQQFISPSTLRRTIAKLTKELEPLRLSLSKGTIIHLKGPEHQIRYLFFQYLWSIYRGVKELPWEIDEQISYPIEQLADLFSYEFSQTQRSQLGVLLFIFEKRNAVQATETIAVPLNFEAPSLFDHWNRNEWGTLLFFLSIFPLFFDLSEKINFMEISAQTETWVSSQSDSWFDVFEKHFSVTIDDQTAVRGQLRRLFLFNRYLKEVHTLTSLFPIVDDQRLKKIVPCYMETFADFMSEFLTKTTSTNPKMTELFSLLLANLLIPYLTYRPKARLYVLSDLGPVFEQLQKDLLIAALSNHYQLEFVEDEVAADLILSNMPTQHAKALQIRSTINTRDIRLIRQALAKRTT